MTLDPKILAELVARLSRAGGRAERNALVGQYASLCRMSVAQVRRLVKAGGVASGYAARKDTGGHRRKDLEQAADRVATIIAQSHGAMPTWRAIQIAQAQGAIDPGLELALITWTATSARTASTAGPSLSRRPRARSNGAIRARSCRSIRPTAPSGFSWSRMARSV